MHGPFPFKKILQWRQSGPFTDSGAGSSASPDDQSATLLGHQLDEDDIMEDLNGQDLDEMTRQLVSFRQPGCALYRYVRNCNFSLSYSNRAYFIYIFYACLMLMLVTGAHA